MILKKIAIGLLTGASIVTALLLLVTAYSDRIAPTAHPHLACLGMVFPFMVVANLLFVVLWVCVAWRRTWIPVAALVVSYPAIRVFMPLHFTATPPEGCLRLLSYNVCGYTGNGKFTPGIDTIFAYIAQTDADIVCTQEDQNTKDNPVDRWAALYPYNDTTHVSRPSAVMVNIVGLHSRYPIVGKERISYTSEANGSVAYRLLVDGDTVIVINNHLESTHLSADDRRNYKDMLRGDMDRKAAESETRLLLRKLSEAMSQRAGQADAVHRYVESHRRQPVIVCGDFNDTPVSYTRRTIAQGLTDCYVETGVGLGLSYNQKGFNFRIDHILCSEHFVPYVCDVDSKMEASDHYPIACWLKKVDKP